MKHIFIILFLQILFLPLLKGAQKINFLSSNIILDTIIKKKKYQLLKIYEHPIYSDIIVKEYYSLDNLLVEKKELKKGLIKFNNSWAGSSNTLIKYEYNEKRQLVKSMEYWSNTRWFKNIKIKTDYFYSQNGNEIKYERTTFEKNKIIFSEYGLFLKGASH